MISLRVHKGRFYSFIKCESLKIIEESVLDDTDTESKFSEYFKKVIEAHTAPRKKNSHQL